MRHDLIVVGAGTAGLACALAAADSGAHPIVIEKSTHVGGTLHVSGGHMSAGGTRLQRERGIEDSPDRHFEDVMRISRGTADPVLVRLAVEEAPRTLDWLDELGFPFAPETPALVYQHEAYSVPRTVWGERLGLSILETLLPRFQEHIAAGRIQLLLEHELVDIAIEDGSVSGVVARGPEGIIEPTAHAVVLATGGYAANENLFARVTPGAPQLVTNAPQTSTGDGIEIARRLGAAFRFGNYWLPSCGGIESPPGSGRVDWREAWAHVFPDRVPREIYVNANGQRVIAEDVESVDALERALAAQPEGKLWIVFDDAAIDRGSPLVPQWDGETLRRNAHEGKVCWVADDLGTLARKAGVDPTGLTTTVEAWNDAVRRGSDPLGRRVLGPPIATPPYYALLTRATSLVSFGGLAVDGDLRVLDTAEKAITGLYAAGEVIGAGATSGNAFCGGMLVTPALSFGRILGRRLARAAGGTAVE